MSDQPPEYTKAPAPRIAREDRYFRIPTSFRREMRDCPDGPYAAAVDLLLASYDLGGTFESEAIARAMLGRRVRHFAELKRRGMLVDRPDGQLELTLYAALYDGDGKPRSRKSRDERLQDAAAKLDRGEPLTDAETAARHRARRDGLTIPDARRVSSDSNLTSVPTTTNTTTKTDNHHHHDAATVMDLYRVTYGRTPSPPASRWLQSLVEKHGADRTAAALVGEHAKDSDPKTVLGRMQTGLREGDVRGITSRRTEDYDHLLESDDVDEPMDPSPSDDLDEPITPIDGVFDSSMYDEDGEAMAL